MTDSQYGDQARLLRLPELRLVGVAYGTIEVSASQPVSIHQPGRACFYYVKRGRAWLEMEGEPGQRHCIEAGASIGMEDGRSHRWRVDTTGDDGTANASSSTCTLFGGSVDRRHTVIQHENDEVMILPADAEPHASIVRHCVEVLELDLQKAHRSEAVGRRCAEIIQLEMLQYAQSRLESLSTIPDSVRRDAPLLRVWTAFLSDPSKPWTVESLAEVACLSRTAFSTRFHKLTGATPVATLRWLRIRYAAEMLRTTRAPLADIARQVGYGSDVALMRAFRREMGATPAQFRAGSEAGHATAATTVPADA